LGVVGTAQGQWLKTEGHDIVDEAGEPVILRGMGLGGWMLQEGYMLRTGGAQHEIRERIEALVGSEVTEEFYTTWLDNHCRREDIDSLAAWGYNSIRPALHYNLFTPPIQEEPVPGEITWLEDGFARLDSLVQWAHDNRLWVILDMHAAPGGQGENADISDYDPDLPSLWESEENQDKLVALWQRLAERYADDPTIAAYDLINETNWGFQNHSSDLNGCAESSNAPLWDLQRRITEAIREVDTRHMIVIEGNCWGNNYNGLNTLWDDNIIVSYHKYWNPNTQGDAQPYLDTRNKFNAPIWLGETGENSNTWFTDAITLLESNGIGWSMWPLKKMGGNNPFEIEITQGYQEILDYWNNSGPKPSAEEATATLRQMAENLKVENNTYHPDVVDAMIRQPHSTATLPWADHVIEQTGETRVFFTDYDLGRHTYAYQDEDYTNESRQPGGAGWNFGGGYRNDGVDIEACTDFISNGFNVGWTQDGEWMQYTVTVESAGLYDVKVRYALKESTSSVQLATEGITLTDPLALEITGDYQAWATATWQDVPLSAGSQSLRLSMVEGGANLNYLAFTKRGELSSAPFLALGGATNADGDTVYLHLNKRLADGTPLVTDFALTLNGEPLEFDEVGLDMTNTQKLYFTLDTLFDNRAVIEVAYTGSGLKAEDGSELVTFSELEIANLRPYFHQPPAQIEAEDFSVNEGFGFENTTDQGGGVNVGYTDEWDYLEYDLSVPNNGEYIVRWRLSSEDTDSRFRVEQRSLEGEVLHTYTQTFGGTGGWQNWVTQGRTMELSAGITKLRLVVEQPRFNLNWFEIILDRITGLPPAEGHGVMVYPNPVNYGQVLHLERAVNNGEALQLQLVDAAGRSYLQEELQGQPLDKIRLPPLQPGLYFISLMGNQLRQVTPLLIQ